LDASAHLNHSILPFLPFLLLYKQTNFLEFDSAQTEILPAASPKLTV
jgi:hypothetical protein